MKFNLGTDKGNYRVTFTYFCSRYSIYLGTADSGEANRILKQIYLDWEDGKFDWSFEKYKKFFENLNQKKDVGEDKSTGIKRKDLLFYYLLWVKELPIEESVKNNHYKYLSNVIEEYNPDIYEINWLLKLKTRYSPSTYNMFVRRLKSCNKWMIEKGFVDSDYFGVLKNAKEKGSVANPFNDDEVKKIIEACNDYPVCKDFVIFQFNTGCRPGEALALEWDDIDYERKEICISKSYSRVKGDIDQKQIKSTKTGKVRFIPINETLFKLLSEKDKKEKYVFNGVRAEHFDYDNFITNYWPKILKKAGIKYRNFYQTRHTVLSKITTEQGLLAASQVAGHESTANTAKFYARFTGDVSMPEF